MDDWIKKWKEGFLTALATAIKKDPTTSEKKCANELKVNEKSVRTVMKQHLSPDSAPWLCLWGDLENKTNATSHRNIGSLKTAIEEEWNKMSEEFMLKACKSFRWYIDTIVVVVGDRSRGWLEGSLFDSFYTMV